MFHDIGFFLFDKPAIVSLLLNLFRARLEFFSVVCESPVDFNTGE